MQKATKDAQLYSALRSQILNHAYRPGDRLVEEDICRRYTMTRTPVRRALSKLEQEGLVVSQPFAGCHVRELAVDEIGRLFEIREVLEGLAARNAALRATPDDLRELRDLAQAVDQAAVTGDWPAYFERDRNFHQRLVACSGNANLIEILEVSSFHIRSFALYDLYLDNVVSAIKQLGEAQAAKHVGLALVLESRHADAAEVAVREHIRMGSRMILGSIEHSDQGRTGTSAPLCLKQQPA